MKELIDSLDKDLRYAIEVEGKWQMEDAENYEEVRDSIREQLESLRDRPNREETPLIYHLDVAAMYPNIILTNRYVLYRVVSSRQARGLYLQQCANLGGTQVSQNQSQDGMAVVVTERSAVKVPNFEWLRLGNCSLGFNKAN